MLDLTLQRLLATGDDLRLALHLHQPHRYRHDGGGRWIDVARRDPRLSLLLDVQPADAYLSFGYAQSQQVQNGKQAGQVIFHCSPALAASLISAWDLPASAADLGELPGDTAIAHLPGMVVTLKVSSQ